MAPIMLTRFDPPDLTLNERRTLALLFRHRQRTQGQIASALDITQQSASRILARLTGLGAIRAGERIGVGARGYPSNTVQLVPGFAAGLGLSVAAGDLTLGLVDFAGQVRGTRHIVKPSVSVGDALAWVTDTAPGLAAEAGIASDRLIGIGLAISGSFTREGEFNTPHRLNDWANRDIAALVRDQSGLPAFVDNDGNAAALAESLLGLGQQLKSFAYLYIGAGVGGGVILDGEPWRGRHGNAGEFAGGLQPGLNPFPSLELLRQGLANHGQDFDSVGQMLAQLDPDWPAVGEWIVKIRGSLCMIASNAASILDVDAVVLGGQLPASLAERLIPHISFFDQRRRGQERPVPRILAAEVQSNAAAAGAAILPIRNLVHLDVSSGKPGKGQADDPNYKLRRGS